MAYEDEFVLETFLHGCFSKAAANIISYFDVMLKRKEFLWFFLSEDLGEKCKHTELALNFVQIHNLILLNFVF